MKLFTKFTVAAAFAFAALGAAAETNPVGFVVAPDMTDDDEVAAQQWATAQGYQMIQAADLAKADPQVTPVLWVMVDRMGMEPGIANLPFTAAQIEALKSYSERGGNLYLSNQAVQLAAELGLTGEYGLPTVYGCGEGGEGNDVWTLNPVLGIDFAPGTDHEGEQGYYDHSGHAIYKGLEMTDPNGWGFNGVALIGPGHREDHNCIWDLNKIGKGEEKDVIANFEKACNAEVLATWGHVKDHCVAAIVEFKKTSGHGTVMVNGLAANEWHQNSGENIYQKNIEGLNKNILAYITPVNNGVAAIETEGNAAPRWFNLQGVEVANPESGLYILVENGNARKVLVK